MIGTVKWFDPRKGFGFLITPATEIYVHASGIKSPVNKSLMPGDTVEFEMDAAHERGPRAVGVRLKARAPQPVIHRHD